MNTIRSENSRNHISRALLTMLLVGTTFPLLADDPTDAGQTQAAASSTSDPSAPLQPASASATSRGFKKIGSFFASHVLGVDIPVADDTTVHRSTVTVQRPYNPESKRHTPTPDEAAAEQYYALWLLNWTGAQEGIKMGQTQNAVLPTSTAEQSDFDAACLKGPQEFYGEMLANDPKSKSEYAKYSKGPDDWKPMLSPMKISDPLIWCHVAIETLRDAKQVATIAQTKGADAAAVRAQRIEWAHFDAMAKAHHATLKPNARFPSNDQEQAELNAAARHSQKDCLDWVDPTNDHAIMGEQKYSSVGIKSIEEQCNEFARLAKYNDF